MKNKKVYKSNLQQFISVFIVPVVIVALLGAGWLYFAKFKPAVNTYYDSPNTQRVYGDKRVFDYGDQLTDSEERNLEAYIHDAERKTLCDIVIVTLNESLANYEPEYTAKYDIRITPDKYVMVYADKFWEDNNFGYDCPQVLDGTTDTGDGVILVDNVFREPETGRIYTWMGTTGKAEVKYSSSDIDYALDVFYEYVDDDYYKACTKFVDQVVSDMSIEPIKLTGSKITPFVALLYGLVYMIANIGSKEGKVTTNANTYLLGNSLSFPINRDTFIRKNVTKRYNPPSETRSGGGGGGGHHISGGGGSHGGGGHSR
ncbi:MAG: TPM domain-containing protein [Lachnospiraceae bacterium]|nr:TPM domain-containing protein [Lachnospiraceae bacterium]